MYLMLDLMKYIFMLICNFVVYQVEIAINKSLFLLDHKENLIQDNYLD